MQGRAKVYEVQAAVASVCAVSVADFKSASRRRRVSTPRQWAMKLCREQTSCSYPQIGRLFGDRHHTTVMFAVDKISAAEQADPKVAATLNECRAKIAAIVAERMSRMAVQASSSDWSPPPPTAHLVKPDTVVMSIDQRSWLALGGELVAA